MEEIPRKSPGPQRSEAAAKPCCPAAAGPAASGQCCPARGDATPASFSSPGKQPFVTGFIETPAGRIPRISSSLTRADRWGSVRARWGVGRMRYTVEPGLYALGTPDRNCRVLVTANYKMSFDRLRQALPGRDLWILVLDTDGINVWCAAGKGTFGTKELADRIASTGLSRIVAHRQLILPQLAAPGVAGHLVKKVSGFMVTFGPIRASDLPVFLDNDLEAEPGMRLKTFPIRERAVLIPMELVAALKPVLVIVPILLLLAGVGRGPEGFWPGVLTHGLFAVVALFGAILAGAVVTPLLLPWLPGRAFSLKGAWAGLVTAAILLALGADFSGSWPVRIEALGWLFLVPALSAFLAMNFTGASTFTSLSGVRKEMRRAVPLQIGASASGLALWLAPRFFT